jgi:hypothetical protein
LNDLILSLDKDKEFQEIFEEFKAKENLLFGFESLEDAKKLEIMVKCYFIVKSQKDQVIEEYWKIKSESEDKQKIAVNSQIEKYKNEAYTYKCERDELKVQLNNLKKKKDSEKDKEKLLAKYDKYKEKVCDLEKEILRQETEKKENESKFIKEFQEITSKKDFLINQLEELNKKLVDLEDSNENLSRWNEDYKIKLENLNHINKDLVERNISLQRIAKKNNHSNFTSQ